jgi:hypothetical protein
MKKAIVLSFTLCLSLFFISAGVKKKDDCDHSFKVYNSYEDYVACKPVPGVEYNGSEKKFMYAVEIVENGVKKTVKDKDLTYNWFTEKGFLMRVFDHEIYYVLANGNICFYVKAKQASIYRRSADDISISYNDMEKYKDYYSDGINGEIKVLKGQYFEGLLEKNGLLEQYKADKPKHGIKEDDMTYYHRQYVWEVKYKKLVSQK